MGGSVTLHSMSTVKFAPDAAGYFVKVLTILPGHGSPGDLPQGEM